MFSSQQISMLNSAKAEGEAWFKFIHNEVLGEIREHIQQADLFAQFRMALFNNRDPVVILNIDRTKITNHPLSDPVDVHELLLEHDGYETIACEINDIVLSYKVSDDSDIIRLKLRYKTHELSTPPTLERMTFLDNSEYETDGLSTLSY